MRRAGSYLAFAGWAVVGLGSLTVVSACIEDLPEPTGMPGQGAAAGSSATGGGATCYLDGGLRPFVHHPDLIHKGLRWLVEASNTGS